MVALKRKRRLAAAFWGDYSDFSVPLGRTRPIDGFCTTTSVLAAISTVTYSSPTLVTLPIMPPWVTTSSPLASPASRALCSLAFFICGRISMKHSTTNIRIIGSSCMKPPVGSAAAPAVWAWARLIIVVTPDCLKTKRGILSLARGTVAGKGGRPLVQRAGLDGGAHLGHDDLIEMQVVDGVQHAAQDFAAAEQVVEVGTAERGAGVARTRRVERAGVGLVAGVLDLDIAEAGEQVAVAGVAGRHHAVEHVDAALDREDQVFRRADAHQVARLVGRHAGRDVVEDARHVLLRFADRQAANGHAVETDVVEASQRFVAQVFIHAALDDAEQRVAVFQLVVFVARALRPAHAQAHRFGRFLARRRVGRAFVEDHDDVRVQDFLDLHRDFRRQEKLGAVVRRAELDTFLGDLAQGAQREYLEAARVGQDWLVPVHETVQALVRLNALQPRPQPEVEGVAEADLGANLAQRGRRHRLDRAVGADRHEDGRLDDAVGQGQRAAAGGAVGLEEFEVHGGSDFDDYLRGAILTRGP